MQLVGVLSVSLVVLVGLSPTAGAVTCGGQQFFEYKFKPIEIRPVAEAEIENSKKRCDEKHCDLVLALFGPNNGCKKGRKITLMRPPANKNLVRNADFTPNAHPETGYKQFHQWAGEDNTFNVEVCDEDTIGKNDKLMNFEIRDMREGCHRKTHNDRHAEHPWTIEYEICCRPVRAGGNVGSRGGNRGNHYRRFAGAAGEEDSDWMMF